MDWRHRALCRDEDPELFFPIGTTGPALVQIEQAKGVCRRCPVIESCLDWALRPENADAVRLGRPIVSGQHPRLDLTEVEFIDSSGLAVLVKLPGDGPRVIHGSLDYGVEKRGGTSRNECPRER